MKVPLLLAALTVVAVPVSAQPMEVAGGYSMGTLSIPNNNDATFPTGWFGGIALVVGADVDLAVIADANYKTLTFGVSYAPLVEHERHVAALAGPRLTQPLLGPVNLFGEILVGALNSGSSTAVAGMTIAPSIYVTNAVWQPGGGIDVQLAKHVAARVELGERIALLHPKEDKILQVATGLVFTR